MQPTDEHTATQNSEEAGTGAATARKVKGVSKESSPSQQRKDPHAERNPGQTLGALGNPAKRDHELLRVAGVVGGADAGLGTTDMGTSQ